MNPNDVQGTLSEIQATLESVAPEPGRLYILTLHNDPWYPGMMEALRGLPKWWEDHWPESDLLILPSCHEFSEADDEGLAKLGLTRFLPPFQVPEYKPWVEVTAEAAAVARRLCEEMKSGSSIVMPHVWGMEYAPAITPEMVEAGLRILRGDIPPCASIDDGMRMTVEMIYLSMVNAAQTAFALEQDKAMRRAMIGPTGYDQTSLEAFLANTPPLPGVTELRERMKRQETEAAPLSTGGWETPYKSTPLDDLKAVAERMKRQEGDAQPADKSVGCQSEVLPNDVRYCGCQTPLTHDGGMCQRCGRNVRPDAPGDAQFIPEGCHIVEDADGERFVKNE